MQLRVNVETIAADGSVRPRGGTLAAFEPPSGPGVRVDTAGVRRLQRPNPRFDSLLAKVIVRARGRRRSRPPWQRPRARASASSASTASRPTRRFLRRLLAHPDVARRRVSHALRRRARCGCAGAGPRAAASARRAGAARAPARASMRAIRSRCSHTARARSRTVGAPCATPRRRRPDAPAVRGADAGHRRRDRRRARATRSRRAQPLVVMEAMKMEHVIDAPRRRRRAARRGRRRRHRLRGRIRSCCSRSADGRRRGRQRRTGSVDLDAIRPDLAEVHASATR